MPILKTKLVVFVAAIIVIVIGGVALHDRDVTMAHRRAEARALALQRKAYARWTSGTVAKPSGQGYGQFSDP